jgi:hypothetical protein
MFLAGTVAGGILVGAGTGLAFAGARNPGDPMGALKAAGIGAVSGAIGGLAGGLGMLGTAALIGVPLTAALAGGAAAGEAVQAAMATGLAAEATIGFAGGVAGGFAGGFAGGTMEGLAAGQSWGDALQSGWEAGKSGALWGGMLGAGLPLAAAGSRVAGGMGQRGFYYVKNIRTIRTLNSRGSTWVRSTRTNIQMYKQMRELTIALDKEVGLAEETIEDFTGRSLWLGSKSHVRIDSLFVNRVIAHTHPSGNWNLSPVDIETLQGLGQDTTVIITPKGGWRTVKVPKDMWDEMLAEMR